MNGPTIAWRAGRVDLASCVASADALLPDATTDGFSGATTANGAAPSTSTFAPNAIRVKMSRMGLNDTQTVALIGAHTVGFCHPTASGFFGSWSAQPFLFTNAFFVSFASTPPNALDTAGVAQFAAAWRADASA